MPVHLGEPYVIQPGDTLTGIAQEKLGRAGEWPRIYVHNNLDQIIDYGGGARLRDPDRIYAGDLIYLPRLGASAVTEMRCQSASGLLEPSAIYGRTLTEELALARLENVLKAEVNHISLPRRYMTPFGLIQTRLSVSCTFATRLGRPCAPKEILHKSLAIERKHKVETAVLSVFGSTKLEFGKDLSEPVKLTFAGKVSSRGTDGPTIKMTLKPDGSATGTLHLEALQGEHNGNPFVALDVTVELEARYLGGLPRGRPRPPSPPPAPVGLPRQWTSPQQQYVPVEPGFWQTHGKLVLAAGAAIALGIVVVCIAPYFPVVVGAAVVAARAFFHRAPVILRALWKTPRQAPTPVQRPAMGVL